MSIDLNFAGFPADTMQFYGEITFNNNKPWFEENKPRFQKNVQKPAQAFVEALGERLRLITADIKYDTRLNGSGSIMRIYRDVRFSKDKTPYKNNLGIVWWHGNGKKIQRPAYYFGLDADSAGMHAGLYYFPKDLVDVYRAAVDDEKLGGELEQIVADLQAAGYTIGGEQYKRVPRGYPQDHPRGELLKYKGLVVSAEQFMPSFVSSDQLLDRCFEHCQAYAPLVGWMAKIAG